MSEIRRPTSSINSIAWLSHEPAVSIAIGWNSWVRKGLYIFVLVYCRMFAAAAASSDVSLMCESAKVSGTMTAHAIVFPLAHGIRVAPSGRFPPCWSRLVGLFDAGTWSRLITRRMMSLSIACHCCHGVLLLQDRPCSPRLSTIFPQMHRCGE